MAGIKSALKGMEIIGHARHPDGPERPLVEVMAECRVALFGKAVETGRPDERKPGRRKKGVAKEKVVGRWLDGVGKGMFGQGNGGGGFGSVKQRSYREPDVLEV